MRGHALGPFSLLSGVVGVPNIRVQGVLVVNVGVPLQIALSASATDPVLLKVRPYTQVATPSGTNSLLLGKIGTPNAYLDTGDSTPGTQGTLSAEKQFVITTDTTLIASLSSTAIAASKVLTASAITGANTQTVTIGATTYTFQTVLTNTANNVLIGADTTAMMANLAAAINAGAGSGTTYGSGTTANASVSAVASTNTLTATALVAGAAGNSIAIGETLTNSAWAGGATTLSGGADSSGTTGQMFIFLDA